MSDVVLSTLNARWTHASLGLRYLMANLGPLAPRAKILEFEIGGSTSEIVAKILRERPRVVGFGVYIWNARETAEVTGVLKRLAPDAAIVVGGPEVSYETETSEAARRADYVVRGEADVAFRKLCDDLLSGRAAPRTIDAPLPEPSEIASPYALYDAVDVAHRTLYVEASRGCPYSCEFCLSALEIPVRQFPIESFLADMDALHRRGARRFKFVDRTFNLNLRVATAILRFFLDRDPKELFLHFEMVPDRFPEELRALVASFPPGSLQFEVGVQTFDDATSGRIARKQDVLKLEDNLRFLRNHTGVHVHADLIVGLPGENVETFAAGFDRLYGLRPHEIQVGVLKRLRGAPIARHDATMVYAPDPPYEVLRSDVLDFETTLSLKRFAKSWDWVANSGNFDRTLDLLLEGPSAFARFHAFSEELHDRVGPQAALHGVSLTRLVERVFEHLVETRGRDPKVVAPIVFEDYARGGRSDVPPILRAHLPERSRERKASAAPSAARAGLERQDRRRG